MTYFYRETKKSAGAANQLSSFGVFHGTNTLFPKDIAQKIAHNFGRDFIGAGEGVQSPMNIELANSLKEIPNYEKTFGEILGLLVANRQVAAEKLLTVYEKYSAILPQIYEKIDAFAQKHKEIPDTKVFNSLFSPVTDREGVTKGMVLRVHDSFASTYEMLCDKVKQHYAMSEQPSLPQPN